MHSGRTTSLSRVLRINNTNYLCSPHLSILSHSRYFTLWQPQMLPFCPNWLPPMWGSLPCFKFPILGGRSGPTHSLSSSESPFFPSSYLTFCRSTYYFSMIRDSCQSSAGALRSSALEDVFLMHPWREMHSTFTYPLLSCHLFLCDLMTFFSVIFSSILSFIYIYI